MTDEFQLSTSIHVAVTAAAASTDSVHALVNSEGWGAFHEHPHHEGKVSLGFLGFISLLFLLSSFALRACSIYGLVRFWGEPFWGLDRQM